MKLSEAFVTGLGLSRFFQEQIDESLIGVFSPGVSTLNLGDRIIAEAVERELRTLFPDRFLVPFSSHAGIKKQALAIYNQCGIRFWGGANMLDLFILPALNHSPDIPLYEAWQYRKAILLGTGTGNRKKPAFSFIARHFYHTVLSSDCWHSVRDEHTKKNLQELGFTQVINTGCPTTWQLTPEHCRKIPAERAEQVVFTLTDYCPDPQADRQLIAELQRQYRKIFFFPQGHEDLQYLRSLSVNMDSITVLSPSLAEYDRLLAEEHVDYIGTRLHGGMRAMQKLRRALIIGIDIRAIEMHRDIGFPMCLRQEQIVGVPSWINTPPPLNLHINFSAINQWKSQFLPR